MTLGHALPAARFGYAAGMSAPPDIRPVAPEAAPALVLDLHDRGYRGLDPRFSDAHMPAMLSYVEQTLAEADLPAHPKSCVWAAYRDGAPVGCVAMVDRGTRGQLRWFVVLPEARGTGAGKALMAAFMDQAARQGWASVYLETVENLPAARALYDRWGFVVTKSAGEDLWHGHGHEVVMERAL